MLDGIRVLDLSRVIAGPYCAMMLADLGADVVKVERPGRGDDMRYLGEGKDGMSLGFATINRNKRAIAVDLQHPEGLKIVVELARRADVVLENFVPGVAERLGLGYTALSAANPAVVYASVSGFGQDGPYAGRPGYNTIAMGMSGLMALTGQPGDPPTRPGGSISDVAASYIAFGAVCAALVQRFRTGRGERLDVSLLASSVALLPDPSAHYFASGVAPKRVGNRNPNVTPAEAFEAADGFINVVILNPDQYAKLCRVLGDEALVTDPRFATNEARIAHHPEFKTRLERALSARTVAEWVERMIAAGIAAGPIYEFDQVFDDAQIRHMGMVRDVEQPGLGAVRMLGFPFAVGGARPPVRRPAPRLGQHTREVLAEIGIGADEIERLTRLGAVAAAEYTTRLVFGILSAVDLRRRMELLTEAALPDREQGMPRYRGSVPIVGRPLTSMGIAQARLPGGGSINLMRVMQTNACSLSCGYCPTYCGGKVPRATVSPEEVATTFMDVNRKGLAQGLFLTSGVPGRATRATDRMLATLDLLRRREGFDGYIHLKLLPGAEIAQVEAATRLATRISVNLEGASDAQVRELAKEKDLSGDLLPKLELAGRLYREARAEGRRGGSTTTQFVVGATGERDREILSLVAGLEQRHLLHHAHFSAFQPVVGTPFENRAPTPAARESRLYQAEHLLREYGFAVDELAFQGDGNLPLEHDPKTAWALAHPERFPLDLMRAPLELLLRVPGIGPKAARTLVQVRRHALLRDLRDVRRLGVDTVRAGFYLTLRGRRLAMAPAPHQLRLFAPGAHLTQAPFRTPVPPCAYR